MHVVLKLLAESVCQPRERRIPIRMERFLPFYERGRDVLRIRCTTQDSSAASDARCWRIARLAIVRCAVDFDQHRVINLRPEGILHGLRVYAMAVCG